MERPTRRAWRAPVSGGPRRAANGDGTCPFVHTGRSYVCFSGHADVDSGGRASVCAHALLWRVQSRTRDWPYRTVLVRLCTRGDRACAKSDTKLAVTSRSCPFVHTPPIGVCKVGHETGRMAPFDDLPDIDEVIIEETYANREVYKSLQQKNDEHIRVEKRN